MAELDDAELQELRASKLADDVTVELLNALTSGFAHTAMLHSALTKAGYTVNGRTQTPMDGYAGRALRESLPTAEGETK